MDNTDITFFVIFYSILFVIMCMTLMISCIARYGIFKKAGEDGWKAFIPFISGYTRAKIVFGKENAPWFLAVFIIGDYWNMYVSFNEAKAFGKTTGFAILHMLFYPITSYILWLGEDKYQGTQSFILD